MRYIDEKDVYKLVEPNGVARVHCSQIDELPRADVVEVVRCEDCVCCRYVDGADTYKCDRRGYYSEEVKPTDYCSRGERRSENEG